MILLDRKILDDALLPMISGNERALRDQVEDKIKRTKVLKEAREQAQDELENLYLISGAERPSDVVRNCFDWLPRLPGTRKPSQ